MADVVKIAKDNDSTVIETGKSKLRPRARIIRTIGDELISNDSVAIIELVKNSYDADSTSVEIEFDLSSKPNSIEVRDNGHGMTLDVIKNSWLEPATVSKKNRGKSGRGRILLGEKGIGRFAAAKLSKKLKIVTRAPKDKEILLGLDWEDFDGISYLDELDCEWSVREPEVIFGSGTIIRLEGLNSEWDKEKIRKLRNHLSRLINPFSEISDFNIVLKMPKELKEFGGPIDPPESLGKPHYMIKGSVDGHGNVEMIYRSDNREEEIKKSDIIKNIIKPECGPFSFEFRVWDRDNLEGLATELGSSVRDIRGILNSACGLSVYRDGFRVMPYGESGDDWLRLDSRRVNNPTKNISNNQIVGLVSITQKGNPKLRDQSNREGVIESKEFEDLKDTILAILSELEIRRYKKRPREPSIVSESIFSKISIEPVAKLVSEKLRDDREAIETLAKTREKIDEGVREAKEVISRYRRLSTLGQLIDIVLHDGGGSVSRMGNSMLLIEREFKKETVNGKVLRENFEIVKNERHLLSSMFKKLEPFGGRRRGVPKDIVIEEVVENVFSLLQKEIEKLDIATEIPKTKTLLRLVESDLDLVIINLLQNSLYWIESIHDKKRKISVSVKQDASGTFLTFSDNGPGINEEDAQFIFDPYFSKKPNGVGLGLTIAGELISENGGSLELVRGPMEGANFKIKF